MSGQPHPAQPADAARAATPLSSALAYAAGGWEVFPLYSANPGGCSCRHRSRCPHPGKHPLTRHGLLDATTDEATIRHWWRCWPSANVAVATGAISGLVVIDVDPAPGGEVSLAHLQDLMGSLPATLTAQTGGGGLHLYYRHPGGLLRNTAGRLPGIDEPLPGVDLRGDGGYVVAPPSRHAGGATYSWVDNTTPMAPAPGWLRPAPQPEFTMDTRHQPLPHRRGSRYGLVALRAEADAVRHAPTGSRNSRLNRAAFCLGMLVAGGELDELLVEETLIAATRDAGLSEGEANASLASGLRAGSREPRSKAYR